MTEITATELKHRIANSPLPLLVDIFTTKCGPCRALAPILDELATEFEAKLTSVKMNAISHDLATQTCADLVVRNVPTLLIFQNGVETNRRTGIASKAELHSWIESSLKS